MSDIKFDGLDSLHAMLNSKKLPSTKEAPQSDSIPPEEEGISIRLSSFADLAASDASLAENTRVLEMKRRIENNHYQINTDVLAKKLLPHLLKTIG